MSRCLCLPHQLLHTLFTHSTQGAIGLFRAFKYVHCVDFFENALFKSSGQKILSTTSASLAFSRALNGQQRQRWLLFKKTSVYLQRQFLELTTGHSIDYQLCRSDIHCILRNRGNQHYVYILVVTLNSAHNSLSLHTHNCCKLAKCSYSIMGTNEFMIHFHSATNDNICFLIQL